MDRGSPLLFCLGEPVGYRTPDVCSSRNISPRDAFFPPTIGTSERLMSANHLMNADAACGKFRGRAENSAPCGAGRMGIALMPFNRAMSAPMSKIAL